MLKKLLMQVPKRYKEAFSRQLRNLANRAVQTMGQQIQNPSNLIQNMKLLYDQDVLKNLLPKKEDLFTRLLKFLYEKYVEGNPDEPETITSQEKTDSGIPEKQETIKENNETMNPAVPPIAKQDVADSRIHQIESEIKKMSKPERAKLLSQIMDVLENPSSSEQDKALNMKLYKIIQGLK